MRESAALLIAVERSRDKVLATVEEIRDEWSATVEEQAEARRQLRERALTELAKADRAVAEAEALVRWLEGFPNGRYWPQPTGIELRKQSGEPYTTAELLDFLQTAFATPEPEAIAA